MDGHDSAEDAAQWFVNTDDVAFLSADEALSDEVFVIEQEKYMDEDMLTVNIPAWDVSSKMELSRAFPEFGTVAKYLDPQGKSGLIQAVKGSYFKEGFKASAITALMVSMVRASVASGKKREYVLTFSKPYSVVAVARVGEWNIPVFSFDVKTVVEAAE